MQKNEIAKGIFFTGVLHPERPIFDSLIPLPRGTSYNSYVVKGSGKTALIDTAEPEKEEEFLLNIAPFGKIDYLISNHSEQDHSGLIPKVLKLHPECKVVTNPVGKGMLLEHHPSLSEKDFLVIRDKDALDLGGKTLEFHMAPWVHWPETMFCFVPEEKVLFTCDFFGSHSSEGIFASDEGERMRMAKLYYAEIMMPYADFARKALATAEKLSPFLIAPAHGPIYSGESVGKVFSEYGKWTWRDASPGEVLVLHVSMHGSTKIMAKRLCESLASSGIPVRSFTLPEDSLGEIASSLIDAKVIAFGTPTYISEAHPAAANVAYLVNGLKPKVSAVALFGSYGWSTKAPERMKTLLCEIQGKFLGPLFVKGHPKEPDLARVDALAAEIVSLMKS